MTSHSLIKDGVRGIKLKLIILQTVFDLIAKQKVSGDTWYWPDTVINHQKPSRLSASLCCQVMQNISNVHIFGSRATGDVLCIKYISTSDWETCLIQSDSMFQASVSESWYQKYTLCNIFLLFFCFLVISCYPSCKVKSRNLEASQRP